MGLSFKKAAKGAINIAKNPIRAAAAVGSMGQSEIVADKSVLPGVGKSLEGLKPPRAASPTRPGEDVTKPLVFSPDTQEALKKYQDYAGQTAVANNTQINRADSDAIRKYQMDQLSRLQDQAQGKGPSYADLQLQQARQGNIAAAMSMAASARGTNRALSARQAQMSVGDLNAKAGLESAMARIKEQQAAEQSLTGAAGTSRGQDLDLAINQGKLDYGTNIANAGFQNDRYGRQTAMGRDILNANIDRNKINYDRPMDIYKINRGIDSENNRNAQDRYNTMRENWMSVAKGLGDAGAKIASGGKTQLTAQDAGGIDQAAGGYGTDNTMTPPDTAYGLTGRPYSGDSNAILDEYRRRQLLAQQGA